MVSEGNFIESNITKEVRESSQDEYTGYLKEFREFSSKAEVVCNEQKQKLDELAVNCDSVQLKHAIIESLTQVFDQFGYAFESEEFKSKINSSPSKVESFWNLVVYGQQLMNKKNLPPELNKKADNVIEHSNYQFKREHKAVEILFMTYSALQSDNEYKFWKEHESDLYRLNDPDAERLIEGGDKIPENIKMILSKFGCQGGNFFTERKEIINRYNEFINKTFVSKAREIADSFGFKLMRASLNNISLEDNFQIIPIDDEEFKKLPSFGDLNNNNSIAAYGPKYSDIKEKYSPEAFKNTFHYIGNGLSNVEYYMTVHNNHYHKTLKK